MSKNLPRMQPQIEVYVGLLALTFAQMKYFITHNSVRYGISFLKLTWRQACMVVWYASL